jgi:hypothetical protein
MQFRLNLQGWEIRGGSHERIQYTDVEAKKAANRNDEAEGTQTEIHRSFANEGAEPTGPRPCRFSAAVVWHMRPAAAGYAVDAGPGHSQSRGGSVRIQALAIFAIGAASIVPAAAQTYNPAYPVCLQGYGPAGNNIDCSYIAPSVQRVGIGPLGTVRYQSIFCAGTSARGLSPASLNEKIV